MSFVSPYKDLAAVNDRDDNPAERKGLCLHCGKVWHTHIGWRCDGTVGFATFAGTPVGTRFETQEMADSLTCTVINFAEPTTLRMHAAPDLSDWRTWRSAGPNECAACGAPLPCRYHS
jgi:hypothetical protein